MGHVTRRNGRWQAAYRDPDQRERTRTFDRKQDAERWLAVVQADMLRGAWVDPTAGQETFGSYAERWLATRIWRPSTLDQQRGRLEVHVLPFLGDKPLASLRTSDLQAWAKGRSEAVGPSTLKVIVQLVRSVLGGAVTDRVIAASPATGLKLAKTPARRVEPLEVGQVLALVDAMPARFRAAAVVAAGAGLRQGEVFGLCVDRVDFLRRHVRVDQQLVTVANRPVALGPPKTAASVRTVPVPDAVLMELTAHLRAFPVDADGLLFSTSTGLPVGRANASKIWRSAAAVAGLPDWASWHDLRHFYASVLIRAGESVKVVQARLGHASAAVTLDVYSHLWPADDDRTRAAAATIFEPGAGLSRGLTADRISGPSA